MWGRGRVGMAGFECGIAPGQVGRGPLLGAPARATRLPARTRPWNAALRMDRGNHGIWQAMVIYIIVLIVIGLIAGAVARLLVPGRDPIGLLGTIALGIVGSFVGGFIWNLIEYHRFAPGKFHTAGIIRSILGAILVLLLIPPPAQEPARPPTSPHP